MVTTKITDKPAVPTHKSHGDQLYIIEWDCLEWRNLQGEVHKFREEVRLRK